MTKKITKSIMFLFVAITMVFSGSLVLAKKNNVPPPDGEADLTMADGNVMYGCYKMRNGQLRIVAGPDECRPSEAPISWSQSGQSGDIDLLNTYVRICENTVDCYCSDEDWVLHGYAECPPEAILVSVGTPLDETDYGFHALCMYLDGTYVNPSYIAIRCLGTPPPEENCVDGVDNDGDTYVDCDDFDCSDDPACGTPEDCTNGVDDDGDTYVDCDDFDCSDDPACLASNLEEQPIVTEICSDGIDNDGDGKTDCKDKKDCKKDPACSKKKKS